MHKFGCTFAHFFVHLLVKKARAPLAVWRQQSLILILPEPTVHKDFLSHHLVPAVNIKCTVVPEPQPRAHSPFRRGKPAGLARPVKSPEGGPQSGI